jgi:hypothetical protein
LAISGPEPLSTAHDLAEFSCGKPGGRVLEVARFYSLKR